MPFVELPSRGLSAVYYTINPEYTDLSMSIKTPPPPSQALDPAKPILVLNHAGTSSSNSFIYQFREPRLREALNLLAFDSRYYGRTSPERVDHFQDLDERADELLDAIDAVIGDRPFSYLGESFVGSHVGTYIAAKRPEQIKAMILLSPSFITDPPIMTETLRREWRPSCESNKFGNGDGSGRLPPEAMEVVADYFFSGATHAPERRQAFINQYQETHAGEDMLKVDQLLHWFERKAPPPEVFAAEWSNHLVSVPEEDKRVETVAGGAHFLATTDSNIVNRFVLGFLKRYNLA
ncbi:hypothetical protein Rhopal_004180-T1 [Rhodotorula paludigena]|uniref:AB hydrolase-1 domain-containing protein n=1 Tax=Rhodotorula paludigena TaxID=86838 RepID=A0AAV5GQ70_9BASI|nr:hypothetical protein Rhopal_004180-T1 [Rhodotorula paludigena]